MWDTTEGNDFYGDACFFFNPPGLKVGGVQKDVDVNFGFLSLYRTPPPMLKTMADVEKEAITVTKEILNLREVYLLQQGKNLNAVLKSGKAVMLSLQGLPEDVDVKRLRKLGIRIVPLMYGSGKSDEDLFTKNEDEIIYFIYECIRAGVKIDLSHCNNEVSRSVVEFVKKIGAEGVVIATHTGCHSVYGSSRNLPDDIIKNIAEMGGIVGISTITFHLHTSDNTIQPLLNHIRHAVSVCGEDNVVIGSDRPYVRMGEKWWEKRTQWMQENLDPEGKMGIRHPDQALILNTPRKMSTIHCAFGESTFYNKELAEKITGRNLHRFITTYM